MRNVANCHSINDLRLLARKRLPRSVFDFIDGGAEDEVSLRSNQTGFGSYELVPRVLTDVSNVDMSTTVMGQRIDMPVILSPTGMSRIFHHRGEAAVAPAAARAGTIYTLSSMSSVSIEDVGALSDGPKWFQIYVWRDRNLVKDFIERARKAGYHALCLTVDVQVSGRRERDMRHGLSLPPKLTPRLAFDIGRHPGWWINKILSSPVVPANVSGTAAGDGEDLSTVIKFVDRQFDRSVTWDDAAWMIKEWGGPFAIKGILNSSDAVRAVEIGASGIIVSNHGGRQLDHTPAPIDVLPEIVDAVAGRADVILDGGVRRGTDVLKAVALGAKACMVGRPYLYGLAAGGASGVDRTLNLMGDEVSRDMILLGTPTLDDIGPHHLRAKQTSPSYPANR